METLQTKTLIYDGQCPMCEWYTGTMADKGLIQPTGRISFEQLNTTQQCQLDLQRARHEIPMIDHETGELRYGLDALFLVFANAYPSLRPWLLSTTFKRIMKPLYSFISYNRRVIAGSAQERKDVVLFAPDFNLGWRMVLISTGFGYTAMCICLFAMLMLLNPVVLLLAVTVYFLLLLTIDVRYNGTAEQKWDYLGHLAVLGFVEGTLFLLTALLARLSGLTGLMFAGQGAGRFLAIALHYRRVKNNQYASRLNYAFAFGAVALVVFIAVLKK